MLSEKRNEYFQKTIQTLLVNAAGEVIDSDDTITRLERGINLDTFHPFFHSIPSLFEEPQDTFTFSCIQIAIKTRLFYFDIHIQKDAEKQQAVLFLQDLTHHYKSVHNIKQVRNESIIDYNLSQERNDELVLHHEFKNRFLVNIGQDIRTPLNGILGFLNILKNTSLSNEQLDLVNIVKQSANNLLEILEDLVDIAKIESGKLEIKNRRFDFYGLLDELKNVYTLRAQEKGLVFELIQDNQIPQFLVSDEGRIRQIYINLLENALRFTTKGSITLRISTPSKNVRRIPVTAEIIDTGVGIPAENLDTLFEDFTSRERKGLFGGSGITLDIVKQLADLMDATLSVASEVDQGSTFTFTVPMGVSHDQAVADGEAHKEEVVKLPRGARYNLLLVEDIEINQFLVLKMFSKYKQYRLDTAKNGEQAVKLVDRFDYDLILMDLTMPVMDGVATANMIRQHSDPKKANVPIIAVTARVSPQERQECKEVGMNGYISKPIDADILFDTIKRQLTKNKNVK